MDGPPESICRSLAPHCLNPGDAAHGRWGSRLRGNAGIAAVCEAAMTLRFLFFVL